MAAVTIFALVSYFIMPADAWLPANRISRFVDSKGVARETVEEVGSPDQLKKDRAAEDVPASDESVVRN